MYLKFFGFKEPPFKLSPDPRFFFFSKKHQEAFSHILYGLKERKGFIAITGEVGTGKTTLCRLLLGKLDPNVRTALLFNPQMSAIELLQSVNQDFGLKGEGTTKKALVDELNRFLLDLLAKGENALLIVDEAQLLTVECLEEVRLLSNLETDREKLIQILLIGQPELREKLNMREMRQLKQRISISYAIEPLEREEVEAYLLARLEVAGAKGKVSFAPKGVDQIYRFSGGFPRLINIAAEQALLAAYVANATYVSESLVQKAIDELKEGEGGPAQAPADRRTLLPGIAVAIVSLFLLAGLWGWEQGFLTSSTQKTSAPPPAAQPQQVPSSETVSPPPAAASAPSAPAPSTVSLFDEAGVSRVERLSETEKGATLTLLNLWAPLSGSEGLKEKDLEEIHTWMAQRDLRLFSVPLNLDRILRLNYPLLFSTPGRGGVHYQVLARVEGEEAVLLDPLSGKKRVPLGELAKGWSGKGLVVWSEIEGVHAPFREVGPDPSIKKIQEIFQKEGLLLAQPDGFWGPQTTQAIRFFQEKEGLKEDGVFGMETHLFLAKRVNAPTPRLR